MANKCELLAVAARMIRSRDVNMSRKDFGDIWDKRFNQLGLSSKAIDALYNTSIKHAKNQVDIQNAVAGIKQDRNKLMGDLGITHPVDYAAGLIKLSYVTTINTISRNFIGNTVNTSYRRATAPLRLMYDSLIGLRQVARDSSGNVTAQMRTEVLAPIKPSEAVKFTRDSIHNILAEMDENFGYNDWRGNKSMTKTYDTGNNNAQSSAAQPQTSKLDNPHRANMQFKRAQGVADALNWFSNSLGKGQGSLDVPFSEYCFTRAIYKQATLRAMEQGTIARSSGQAFSSTNFNSIRDGFLSQPHPDMLLRAATEAEVETFNSNNDIATRINDYVGSNRLAKVGQTLFSPFVKVPLNVASEGMQMNPVIGAASGLHDIAKLWDRELLKSDPNEAYRVQSRAVNSLTNATVGGGLLALGMMLKKQGVILSDNSKSAEDRDTAEATGQIQGQAIRIGGHLVVLGDIHPLFAQIALGAAIQDAIDKATEDEKSKRAGLKVMGYSGDPNYNPDADRVGTFGKIALDHSIGLVTENPIMKNAGGALKAVKDSDNVGDFVTNWAGGLMPGMVKQLSQAINGDGTKRMVDKYNVVDALKQKAPFARKDLAPKIDARGRPVPDKTGLAVFEPFPISSDTPSDPIDKWIIDNGIKVGKVPKGQGETAQQYSDRLKFVGEKVNDVLKELYANSEFKTGKLTPEQKLEIEKTISGTRSGNNRQYSYEQDQARESKKKDVIYTKPSKSLRTISGK